MTFEGLNSITTTKYLLLTFSDGAQEDGLVNFCQAQKDGLGNFGQAQEDGLGNFGQAQEAVIQLGTSIRTFVHLFLKLS